MVDEDRELFERALDASTPSVAPPAGFAEDTAEKALSALGATRASTSAGAPRPGTASRRTGLTLLAVAAALLLATGGAYAYAERRVEGVLSSPRDATGPVAASVGGRATLVVE